MTTVKEQTLTVTFPRRVPGWVLPLVGVLALIPPAAPAILSVPVEAYMIYFVVLGAAAVWFGARSALDAFRATKTH